MAEYIPREAALEIAMQYCPDDDGSCSKAGVDMREMLDEIEAIPVSDVVTRDCYDRLLVENDELRKERPVRHGRWVVSRTDYGWNSAEFPTHCKCDQCGREIPYLDRDDYCPKCGALMDKDGDGE